MRKRVAIIGCGTIGSQVAQFIQSDLATQCELTILCDTHPEKIEFLQKKLDPLDIKTVTDFSKIWSDVDMVVEASSAECSGEIVQQSLQHDKDVIVLSIGGLLEIENLFKIAQDSKGTLYLPSGALAGLDCLSAAHIAGIEDVMIVTRKPTRGLLGAPYLEENDIDLNLLTEEKVIFEGNALEAIKGFPKNINVAALLSLAGIGIEKTRVRIETSPAWTQNSHEVHVKGAFGSFMTRTDNVPDPHNPKTSYLAVLSACALLKKIFSHVKIGV